MTVTVIRHTILTDGVSVYHSQGLSPIVQQVRHCHGEIVELVCWIVKRFRSFIPVTFSEPGFIRRRGFRHDEGFQWARTTGTSQVHPSASVNSSPSHNTKAQNKKLINIPSQSLPAFPTKYTIKVPGLGGQIFQVQRVRVGYGGDIKRHHWKHDLFIRWEKSWSTHDWTFKRREKPFRISANWSWQTNVCLVKSPFPPSVTIVNRNKWRSG